MPDQNPQSSRRQHFHRGRRGPDKRGPERRPQQPGQERQAGENVDVEQIMRDIRARISQKHGIELSNQQIHELAARRLEAILDPRTVKPALLDQLRKSAGAPAEIVTVDAPAAYAFEDDTLYASKNGLVRFIRRVLNPVLKLVLNPNPLIQALNTQARVNQEALRRETERDRRQAEWNALHYTILQRLVVEISRVSLEAQSFSLRVESLAAKVDFSERRVRGLESTPQQAAPAPRVVDAVATTPPPGIVTSESVGSDAQADVARRRRRRRRGRRGAGMSPSEATGVGAVVRSGSPAESPGSTDDDRDDIREESGSEADQDDARSAPMLEQRVIALEDRVPQPKTTEGTVDLASLASPSSVPGEALLPKPVDPPDPGPTDR